MAGMIEQLVQSKLVLLGEMGSGKTSLVQRFVRGQYFENQVRGGATTAWDCPPRRLNHRPADLALREARLRLPGRPAHCLETLLPLLTGIHHRCFLLHQDHPREARQV